MFCPYCGKQAHDDAKFCSKCGKQIHHGTKLCPNCGYRFSADAPCCPMCGPCGPLSSMTVRPTPVQPPALPVPVGPIDGSGKSKALTIADVLLVLAAFLPWIDLNLYVYSNSYSLIGFATMLFDLTDANSSLLGMVISQTEEASYLLALAGLVFVVWLVMILILGVDAYRRFVGKKGMVSGFVIAAVVASTTILACLVLDSSLAQAVGVGTDYMDSALGIVSATPLVWIYTLVSFGCVVAHAAMDNKS